MRRLSYSPKSVAVCARGDEEVQIGALKKKFAGRAVPLTFISWLNVRSKHEEMSRTSSRRALFCRIGVLKDCAYVKQFDEVSGKP